MGVRKSGSVTVIILLAVVLLFIVTAAAVDAQLSRPSASETVDYTISGQIQTSSGSGIGGVTLKGLPGDPVTAGDGSYSVDVEEGWSGTAQPVGLPYTPPNRTYNNITADLDQENYVRDDLVSADLLLVDDDSNIPDVQEAYTDALDALAVSYHVWNTYNSDIEPSSDFLAPYEQIVWFTGSEASGYAGPNNVSESALGNWLDNLGCLFISSQDYTYDRGHTPFMTDYFGLGSLISDGGDFAFVTGQGLAFTGLGPYSLDYPFINYSDVLSPNSGAEIAFVGDGGSGAAISKHAGHYQTTFWGFPFEALATDLARSETMKAFLDWCNPLSGSISGTVTAENGGAPSPQVDAWLWRKNGTQWEYLTYTHTGNEGQYIFGKLGPGIYRIEFAIYANDYLYEAYDDAASITEGTDIPVSPGLVTGPIDVQLAGAGHITGTVTAEGGGMPLNSVYVAAYAHNGSYWSEAGWDYSDSKGNYDIGGLDTGTYRVGFSHSSYVEEFYDDELTLSWAVNIPVTAGTVVPDIDARLSIPQAPAHDDFDTAQTVAPIPYRKQVDITLATRAADDPLLPCGEDDQGIRTLWYELTPDFNSLLTVNTSGSKYVTIVVVWEGTRGSLSDIACSHRTWEFGTLLTGTPLEAGTTYMIEIADAGTHELALPWLEVAIDLTATPDISLASGWNMVSSFNDADAPDLETMLASIESDLVLVKNGDGAVYWPAMSINHIGSWDVLDGYQIYMDNPAVLSITGQQVDPAQTPVPLGPNWNLAAYLRDSPMPVEQALGSIGDELILAKNGHGEVYWPAFGVDQIGSMNPSAGYQIVLSAPGTLVFPAN